MSFKDRIKALLKMYRLTAVSLARYSKLVFKDKGFNRSTVYSWLSDNRLPSIVYVRQLSLMFGITADWLLGLSDDIYSKSIVSDFENKHLQNFITYSLSRKNVKLPFEIDLKIVKSLNLASKAQLFYLLANISLMFKNSIRENYKNMRLSEKLIVDQFVQFIRKKKIKEFLFGIRVIAATGKCHYMLEAV